MTESKILHIVRHAKSSWDLEDVSDVDRPLTDKGIWKAYQVAEKIRQEYPVPDLLISSHAIRALHTAMIFAGVFGFPYDKIKISALIYGSASEEIADLIMHTNDKITSLMLFGHNPDITELVNAFGQKAVKNVPTSGIVTFEFKTASWKNIEDCEIVSQVNNFSAK